MRKMAPFAAVGLKWLMYHFLFELLLRVALITKIAPFGFKQVIRLRCVRVMAERTLPIFQRCVNMSLVGPDLLLAVTGIAGLIPDILQNELGDDAVAEMAILAFFFFDDNVHIFHRKIFLLEFSMAV